MSRPTTDAAMRHFRFIGYISIFLMIGLGGAWTAFASLNGAVIASGTVVSETNAKRVQQKDGGIVRQILVEDGDRVVEGQDLIVLDDTEIRSELAIIDALLVEEEAKQARLQAQLADADTIEFPESLEKRQGEAEVANIMKSQSKLHEARRAALNGKIDQLSQQILQLGEQIDGVTAQISSKDTQIKLIEDELVDLRKLQEDGLVPKARVLAMEREKARLDGERGELIGARAAAKSRTSEINMRIIQMKEDDISQALLDLRQSEARIAELDQRKISASSRLERLVIKSPITGSIFQLMVHTEGGVITPAETLMMISPEADELVLQAQVSPKNIEQVREGQKARVRFPAFNSHTTPELQGDVSSVSSDVSRMSADAAPFYVVRIRIPAAEIKKLGDNKLKAGMPAEVFIQTDARTPLSYLVKPLTDQLEHAWRER